MAEIIWHKRVYSQRKRILLRTAEIFGISVAQNLNRKIEESAASLKINPRIGFPDPAFKDLDEQEIRSVLILKRFKLVYIIKDEESYDGTVMILSLWDTRRNPDILRNNLIKDI